MFQRQLHAVGLRQCRCTCGRSFTPRASLNGNLAQSKMKYHVSPRLRQDEDSPRTAIEDRAPRRRRDESTNPSQDSKKPGRQPSQRPSKDPKQPSAEELNSPFNKPEQDYVAALNETQKTIPIDFVPDQNDSVETWRVMKAVEREAIITLVDRNQSLAGKDGDPDQVEPESEEETRRRRDGILQKIVGGKYDHVSLDGNQTSKDGNGQAGKKTETVLQEVKRIVQGNATYRPGDIEAILARLKRNVGETARKQV